MEKAIIFDDNCPMCRLYTKGFVKMGLLKEEQRLGNSGLADEAITTRVDPQRARHEIPLVDLQGGETLYGVDALLELLGSKSRAIRYLGSVRWVKMVLYRLYAFISYNRRIVVPTPADRWELMDFEPQFHARWRLLFLAVVFGLVGALHVTAVGTLKWSVVAGVAVQIGLVAAHLRHKRTPNYWEHLLDYTGHLGMSLLPAAVLLSIALPFGWTGLAVAGVALSIWQHYLRTQILGLSPWLTVIFAGIYFALMLT
ncbi:thiol-disulfide oxidoreductase DCC family protein [Tellurirhabdus rosea]|uniref:hypothetical protein n=1 Tax=Tellurirhabdus rosea TaxID=2674997 RepID=UPI0022579FA3|nr:hypothetical protein [Tellurirhabdus rosea]